MINSSPIKRPPVFVAVGDSNVPSVAYAIPFVLAFALIGFSIWPETKAEVETKTVLEIPDRTDSPVSVTIPLDSPMETLAQVTPDRQAPVESKPNSESETTTPSDVQTQAKQATTLAPVESQSPVVVEGDAIPKSHFLECIEAFNSAITNKKWNTRLLAGKIDRYFKAKPGVIVSDAIASGLDIMGIPDGVTSISKGVGPHQKWLAGADQVAFTYQIDVTQLESNARRLVNGMLGDDLYDPVIEDIHRDPEGPRVDLRSDVFGQIKGSFILVAKRHAQPAQDKLLLAIEMKDAAVVQKVIDRIHRVEPDSMIHDHRGHRIHVIDRNQDGNRNQNGTCLAESHLLIGDPQWIKETLDRINGATE